MPDPTLQDLQSVTIGASGFVCTKYSYSSKPILSSGSIVLPIGAELRIEGEIEVTGATPQLLANAVAAACAAMNAVGVDVIVASLGVVESQILAAWCIDAGPRLEYKVIEQAVAGSRRITFAAVGATARDSSGGAFPDATADPDRTSQFTTQTGADGLRSISKAGELLNSTVVGTQVVSIESGFRSQYPWPYWSVSKNIQADQTGKSVKYTFSAKQMSTLLPAAGGVRAVDGSITHAREIDVRRGRNTTTMTVALDCDGYPAGLADYLRPIPADGQTLTRDSVSITELPQWTLSASWVLESGSEGNQLTDWQQQWDKDGDGAATMRPLKEVAFPGGEMILIYGTVQAYRYVQRGKAVGIGRFILPPQPLFPNWMAAPPKVSFNYANLIDKETTWEYQFISKVPLVVTNDQLDRPRYPEVW